MSDIAVGVIVAVLSAIFLGLLGWACNRILQDIKDVKTANEASNALLYDNIMSALRDYIPREQHVEQHTAIDNRLRDHALRLKALEDAQRARG